MMPALIKKAFDILVKNITKVLAFLFSYSSYTKLNSIRNRLYTYWILKYFKSFGDNSLISIPIYLKGAEYIDIASNVTFGKHVILNAWRKHNDCIFNPSISIGSNTSIGDYCHISAINKIQIGNNILMGRFILISDNSHGEFNKMELAIRPGKRKLVSKGPIIIDDNVWIGDKVTILSNVSIGKNTIIAANAVVTASIPENCIAGGIPARVIRKL